MVQITPFVATPPAAGVGKATLAVYRHQPVQVPDNPAQVVEVPAVPVVRVDQEPVEVTPSAQTLVPIRMAMAGAGKATALVL